MKFLFSHRNFPAQFRYILPELAKDSANEVVFITNAEKGFIPGVKKIQYNLKRKVPENCHRYLRMYEESVNHGQAAAEAAITLKNSGFEPDVIFAHAWGNSMFFKDIFPDTPILILCEWYYNAKDSYIEFSGEELSYDRAAMTRCANAQFLIDIVSCTKGLAPSQWQKQQFPDLFKDKIKVIHDGVDTDYLTADENAVLKIPNSDITLSKKDKVVTYATRGMEPCRGFPEFMKMAEKLLKKRPDVHIVVAGEDRVCYGETPPEGSYKKKMLKELDLDLKRVHFTDRLPFPEYKKLLQISSAHVYLTYPFVLSWSMLEAMACECCIIASKTPPVEEVITHNKNGLLFDFYNTDELLEKVEFALDNQDKMQALRHNARETILSDYNIKKTLPEQIKLLKSLAKKSK